MAYRDAGHVPAVSEKKFWNLKDQVKEKTSSSLFPSRLLLVYLLMI